MSDSVAHSHLGTAGRVRLECCVDIQDGFSRVWTRFLAATDDEKSKRVKLIPSVAEGPFLVISHMPIDRDKVMQCCWINYAQRQAHAQTASSICSIVASNGQGGVVWCGVSEVKKSVVAILKKLTILKTSERVR